MVIELIPFSFEIDPVAIAGAGLWSLALYVGFSPQKDWLIGQLQRWFNFAERSFYESQEEFDRTKVAREAQNTFYASLFSIVPFLIMGGLCDFVVELGLGQSWAISTGLLGCIASSVYELGRRHGQSS